MEAGEEGAVFPLAVTGRGSGAPDVTHAGLVSLDQSARLVFPCLVAREGLPRAGGVGWGRGAAELSAWVGEQGHEGAARAWCNLAFVSSYKHYLST